MRRSRLRFTVRRLMVVVAVVGVLLWAWLYRRQHGDIERSLTSNRLSAFTEGDATQRRMAVVDLASTGPDDLLRVLPALASAAADDDWRTRLAAVHSTGAAARRWTIERQRDAGEEISPAKRVLIRAFDDPRGEVRLEEVNDPEERAAIGWSFSMPPAPPLESVPALLDALALDEYPLNQTIPVALSKLGPAGRPALPALAKAAAREFREPPSPALAATTAVATIDRDSAEAQALLAPLMARLRDSAEPYRRQQAAMVLDLYGPSAAAVAPELRGALRRDVADMRRWAASLLGTIGPAARPALADLADRADHDPDRGVRLTAAQAVKRIEIE